MLKLQAIFSYLLEDYRETKIGKTEQVVADRLLTKHNGDWGSAEREVLETDLPYERKRRLIKVLRTLEWWSRLQQAGPIKTVWAPDYGKSKETR